MSTVPAGRPVHRDAPNPVPSDHAGMRYPVPPLRGAASNPLSCPGADVPCRFWEDGTTSQLVPETDRYEKIWYFLRHVRRFHGGNETCLPARLGVYHRKLRHGDLPGFPRRYNQPIYFTETGKQTRSASQKASDDSR